jgi:DNA-3-methyladenine glycosylase II
MRQHWRGTTGLVPLSFLLDGDFTPVAAATWWADGELKVEVSGTERVDTAVAQVARIYSLEHDATDYPQVGRRDPRVGRLMEALPGLRPICFTSPYETAAWGVISQRISMRQAAAIKARLIEEHGHRLRVAGVEVAAFPEPERLLRIESVTGLGAEKSARLRGVARAALDGKLDAARLLALGRDGAVELCRTIPGIGPFWASGIYLRGCGVVDEFADEPISIAALGHLHGLGDQPSAGAVKAVTDVYRPFRMWVCFLLRVAVNRGLVDGVRGPQPSLST